ncbi:MAG: type II secretion system minor pseudopilin GspJ [Chromatiales bacterium]|jgi:general secretion pathway protein J
MQTLRPLSDSSGFTLLELLIAITIFSIISAITYSGLKTVLDTEQQTDAYLARLARLQLCLTLIERDIEQAVPRYIRDEFGDSQEPMIGGDTSEPLLVFTRGGYPNPMQLLRSNLQRVGYQLEDGVLYRISWQMLDRPPESTPTKTRLLDAITSVKFVYFDQQMKPDNQWPPSQQPETSDPPNLLPKAIEMTLELEKFGKIRRLYRVVEIPPTTT